MTADEYLLAILQRENVDTGLFSPVRNVQTRLEPIIREWAGGQLLGVSPSGSFAKGTANHSGTDIDLFIPHQANMRIIESTARYAKVPMEKVFVNVDRYGNMSSATIPVALDEAIEAGRLKPGDNVLMAAFGAGFTWASAVLRW